MPLPQRILVIAATLVLSASLSQPAWGQAELENPSILILATEQVGPDQVISWTDVVWSKKRFKSKTKVKVVHRETGTVQATLSSELLDHGFRVVDPDVLHGKLAKKRSYTVSKLGAKVAQSLARKADVDYVIEVRAKVDLAKQASLAGSGMKSAQASVVARLIQSSDGSVVAAVSENAAQIHINPDTARINALNKASEMAVRNLMRKLR